jgi:hypothetical protein
MGFRSIATTVRGDPFILLMKAFATFIDGSETVRRSIIMVGHR